MMSDLEPFCMSVYSQSPRWPLTGNAGLSAEAHAAGDTPSPISQEVSAGACARWHHTSRLRHVGRTGAVRDTDYYSHKSYRNFSSVHLRVSFSVSFIRTYKAKEHLVQHGTKAPPVHCAVVRLLPEHLWSKILKWERGNFIVVTQAKIKHESLEGKKGWFPSPPNMWLTSGVPQNVVVVASGSSPSLHRPKSVSTTWPLKKKKERQTDM